MFYSKLDSLYFGNRFLMDCQLVSARTKLDCISTYNQYQSLTEKKIPLRFSTNLELIKELHHALNQNDINAYNTNLSPLQNRAVYHERKSHLYRVLYEHIYPLEVIDPNYIDSVELMYLKREEARLDYRLYQGDVSRESLNNLYRLEEQNLCSSGREALIKLETDNEHFRRKSSNKVIYYIYSDHENLTENQLENITDHEKTLLRNPIGKLLSDPLANYKDSFLSNSLSAQRELFNDLFHTLNSHDENAYNCHLSSIENDKIFAERKVYLEKVLSAYKSRLKKIPNLIISSYIKKPYVQREKARSIFRKEKGDVSAGALDMLLDLEIENRCKKGVQVLLDFEKEKLNKGKGKSNNSYTEIYFINEKDIEILDIDLERDNDSLNQNKSLNDYLNSVNWERTSDSSIKSSSQDKQIDSHEKQK